MFKILLVRILILCTTISIAQNSVSWNTKRDRIKIPFEISHNLIIVDVVFNDVKLKMIPDTGILIFFCMPNNESIVMKDAYLKTVLGASVIKMK